jgi:NAD+--asparagine ADP-ribosyltransferase
LTGWRLFDSTLIRVKGEKPKEPPKGRETMDKIKITLEEREKIQREADSIVRGRYLRDKINAEEHLSLENELSYMVIYRESHVLKLFLSNDDMKTGTYYCILAEDFEKSGDIEFAISLYDYPSCSWQQAKKIAKQKYMCSRSHLVAKKIDSKIGDAYRSEVVAFLSEKGEVFILDKDWHGLTNKRNIGERKGE